MTLHRAMHHAVGNDDLCTVCNAFCIVMKRITVITGYLITAQIHTNYIQCAQPIMRIYFQFIEFLDSWNIKVIPQLLIMQTPFCTKIDRQMQNIIVFAGYDENR